MKKLVIIPAYNEEESILETVRDIRKNAADFDYVVINDCSKDRTLEICRANGIHVLDLPVNLGIGGAVQTGYLYALKNGYDIAVQVDGDGQHDAKYLRPMLEALERESADMVIGSRFINNEGCDVRDAHVQPEGAGTVCEGLPEGLPGAGSRLPASAEEVQGD